MFKLVLRRTSLSGAQEGKMTIRIPALLLLALWLAPSVEAGLFGSSNKKKLPKPINLTHMRSGDSKRLSKLPKIHSRYGPEWGIADPLRHRPVELRQSHFTEF
jgi:hypothetical protein